MTNKKIISAILGVMCFALTYGICVQIKTVTNSNSTVSQNYEENNLRAEVLKYKERYENKFKELDRLETELESYIDKATKNNSDLTEAQEKIKKGNKINGTTEVKGPGVIVTLNDGTYNENTLNVNELLVHYTDIIGVVNELQNAGAEAISVNDQRIVLTSAISCGGNIITVNGEKIGTPFVIKAIGLPEQLSGALKRTWGYIDLLENAGVRTNVEKTNNLAIPKYSGVINYKYLKNAE